MSDINTLSTEIVDKHGNIIRHTDQILYNGLTYIVMKGAKYGAEWTGYPCGNNPSIETITLNSIPSDQFELM